MQDEGVGADVGGHHQPAAIHLLPQRPDVYGQRGQLATGGDQGVGEQDGAAEVQRDKAASSWEERREGIATSPRKRLGSSITDIIQADHSFTRRVVIGRCCCETYQSASAL